MLAIIAMSFDHFVAGFIPVSDDWELILRIPGGIAAPIMCYMIAEGYHYTSNIKKYILRLLLFAALSHVPYILYFRVGMLQTTSVMWGLALGLLVRRL